MSSQAYLAFSNTSCEFVVTQQMSTEVYLFVKQGVSFVSHHSTQNNSNEVHLILVCTLLGFVRLYNSNNSINTSAQFG